MTSLQLRAWMLRHDLRTEDAARLLGRSRAQLYHYLSGYAPIPVVIERLCLAYDRGFLPKA